MKLLNTIIVLLFPITSMASFSHISGPVDFGDMKTSSIQTVIFKNEGSQKATLSVSLDGPDKSKFIIALNRCKNVVPQTSCPVQISGKRTQQTNAAQNIAASLLADSLQVELQGYLEALAVLPSQMTLEPNRVSVIQMAPGQRSALLGFKLRNTGGGPGSAVISATDANIVINRCEGTIAPSKECALYLQVNHRKDELYSASISIDGSDELPKTVAVPVRGSEAPDLEYIASGFSTRSKELADLKACDGPVESTRTFSQCLRQVDGEPVGLELCSDPLATIILQSPQGQYEFPANLGTRYETCAEGSDERVESYDCPSSAYINSSNKTCDLITYEAHFSEFPMNTKTIACSGRETVSKTLQSCTMVHNGQEAPSLSLCTEAAPTTEYRSPAGPLPAITIAHGNRVDSCEEGETDVSSVYNCDPDAYYNANESSCSLITYTGSYGAFPPSGKTVACSGTEVVTRPKNACTVDHTGLAASSLALCTDEPAPQTNLSPIGTTQVQLDVNSYKVVSCTAGQLASAGTFVSNNCYDSANFTWDPATSTCKESGWPKGTDGDITVAAAQTYTIQRSVVNPAKLRVMNGATIVYDRIGSYTDNSAGGINETCFLDLNDLNIPTGATLNVDMVCKWLMLGVKTATINGSLKAASNSRGITTTYSSKRPDSSGALTGTSVSYTITQNSGAAGVGCRWDLIIFGSTLPGTSVIGGASAFGNGGGAPEPFCNTNGGTATENKSGNSVHSPSGSAVVNPNGVTQSGQDGAAGAFSGTYSGPSGGFRGAHGQGIYLVSKQIITGSGSINVSGQKGGNGGSIFNPSFNKITGAAGGAAGGSGGKIIVFAPSAAANLSLSFQGGGSGITPTVTPAASESEAYYFTFPSPYNGAAGNIGSAESSAP